MKADYITIIKMSNVLKFFYLIEQCLNLVKNSISKLNINKSNIHILYAPIYGYVWKYPTFFYC